jgi:hypothetical protein
MRVSKRKQGPDDMAAVADAGSACAVESTPASAAQVAVPASMFKHDATFPSVVIGELIAMIGDDSTPLVRFPGQPGTAALRARTIVDLGARDIGKAVALVFEGGSPHHPIAIGLLHGSDAWPLAARPAEVEVDADGLRMQISAKRELILKCGKASITLTQLGGISIRGTSVLSEASGLHRIRGASVELN